VPSYDSALDVLGSPPNANPAEELAPNEPASQTDVDLVPGLVVQVDPLYSSVAGLTGPPPDVITASVSTPKEVDLDLAVFKAPDVAQAAV